MSSLIDSILALSYLGLFIAVFAESGLFFGFFLPGDSLLFTAGLFASRGDLKLVWVCLVCFLGAVIGDQVGYWFGAKVGKGLYQRKDSFFFRKEHIEKTKSFYEKYGVATLIVARFTPIVRTFAPIVAGVAAMPYSRFLRFNLIGGLIWGIGMPVIGYYAGSLIPNIDHYLLPILGAIIIISLIPALWHLFGQRKRNII